MTSTSRAPADPPIDWQVEAARYALLRRLAFAMRHEMVVHLQPIGMIAEVMERRLRSGDPDLAQLQESLAKIQTLSRSASRSCLDVITWMAPVASARISIAEGVHECIAQLRGDFSFRGFTLKDSVPADPAQVARAGLRHLLPATLLALTDGAQAPAEVEVRATVDETRAVLTLQLRSTDGPAEFAGDPPYRRLGWPEVEALAAAEGIGVVRDGTSTRITLPRLPDAPGEAAAR